MKILASVLAIAMVVVVAGNAMAQGMSFIQGSDGTSGTVIDFGNGFRSYSDSHGNMGTIMDLGGGFQSYQFSPPQGLSQSGTILTLPPPGSNITTPPVGFAPALVLPPLPKMPIAPVVPFPSSPGAGRFGR